jgi:palmitoyltransferase
MFCIECGNPLPDHRDDSTICSKCKTPLATWWDETSQAFRTNRESILPSPYHINGVGGDKGKMTVRRNIQTIEERHFQGALVCLDGHFEKLPGFGDKTMAECRAMVKSALDASLNKADVRYSLSLTSCLPNIRRGRN